MSVLKKLLFGNEIDYMPGIAFKLMSLSFQVFYFFKPPGRYLEKFGIKPGYTVVDYGCGPGSFIKSASEKVGEKGVVYALDIHELAIRSVRKLISKYKLLNVIPVQADGINSGIPPGTADLIYALDMFHMVKDPKSFLLELRKIAKQDAILILEDGHQPRSLTKEKIYNSGFWEIISENKKFLTCKPLH